MSRFFSRIKTDTTGGSYGSLLFVLLVFEQSATIAHPNLIWSYIHENFKLSLVCKQEAEEETDMSKIRIAPSHHRDIEVSRLSRSIRHDKRVYFLDPDNAIPDWKFEAKVQRLRDLAPDHYELKNVGTPVSNLQNAVALPLRMGSLNKLRPTEVVKWLNKTLTTSTAIVLSPKMDGIAGELHYRNGKLIAAYKRGSGDEGFDITDLAKHVTGVKAGSTDVFGTSRDQTFYIDGDFFVKGEFVMHRSIFAKKYKGKRLFKTSKPAVNERNFVGGCLNRGKITETLVGALNDICFVAYGCEMTTGPMMSSYNAMNKLEQLRLLESFGFITVICPKYPRNPKRARKIAELYGRRYNTRDKNKIAAIDKKIEELYDKEPQARTPIAIQVINDHKTLTEAQIVSQLVYQKHYINYLIDGLVIDILDRKVVDKLGYEADGLRPAFAKSIKLERQDQETRSVTVDQIEYRFTKRGLYTPRVVFKEPVEFDGVKVQYATGHNWKYIRDNQIGPGTKLTIIRSGDVIPFILDVEKPTKAQGPTHCHFCDSKLEENANHLYCPNKKCSGLRYAQLQAFFDIVEVDGMSDGTLEKLFDQGFNTLSKLLTMKSKDLKGLEGFADKKSKAIPEAIKTALADISLARLMHASTMFANDTYSLGETRLAMIINHIGAKTLLSDKFRVEIDELVKIDGISLISAGLFGTGFPAFMKFYNKIKHLVELRDLKKKQGKLKGTFWCFTGWRNKFLQQRIEANGGQMVGTISKARAAETVLLAKGESKKTIDANKLGVLVVPSEKAEKFVERMIQHGPDK